MQIIESVNAMQSHAIASRSKGHLIGLIPTMGSLHEGHLSLIDIARERSDLVVVSIFVNPTQFGPNEDFEKYPRVLEQDLEACRQRGADIVFTPSLNEMYPQRDSTYVSENELSQGLCGVSRPNHFQGVTTVCMKLFNIVRPDVAVFGQKDAQQCAVVRKMIEDLNVPAELIVGPTVREDDGLALSSRNVYLSKLQRQQALRLSQSLKIAKDMYASGTRSVDRIIAEVTHHISEARQMRVIYVVIVNKDTMIAEREIVPGQSILCIAAWADQTRLIDNLIF